MLMDEGLIRAQAMAVRTACAWLPAQRVSDLHERMDRASSSWAGSPWERRPAAHAHTFVLLADVSGDPVLSPVLRGAADMMRELLLAVGPGANGMIVGSRRRPLGPLRGGGLAGAGPPFSEIWIRVALVGAVAGLVVIAVAVSPLGRRSGAHLNPVVTLGLAAQGTGGAADLAAHPLAQATGGITGVALAA